MQPGPDHFFSNQRDFSMTQRVVAVSKGARKRGHLAKRSFESRGTDQFRMRPSAKFELSFAFEIRLPGLFLSFRSGIYTFPLQSKAVASKQ